MTCLSRDARNASTQTCPDDLLLGDICRMRNYQTQCFLEEKIDAVYSMMLSLNQNSLENKCKAILDMSKSRETCQLLRQAGCIHVLLQFIHPNVEEFSMEARKNSQTALTNILNNCGTLVEQNVNRLLNEIRNTSMILSGKRNEEDELTEAQLRSKQLDYLNDISNYSSCIVASLKLTFNEEYRKAYSLLGGLEAMMELLQTDFCQRGLSDEIEVSILRRYIGIILTNLTFSDNGNKFTLCSITGALECIMSLMINGDEELRQCTAFLVRNLSWRSDIAIKRVLKETHAAKEISRLILISKRTATLCALLSVLRNLSSHDRETQIEICEVVGFLPFLVQCLAFKSENILLIENAASILKNLSPLLSTCEKYHNTIRNSCCLQALVNMLTCPSIQVISHVCITIWNLCSKSRTDQQHLIKLGAIELLKSLTSSNNKAISVCSKCILHLLVKPKKLGSIPAVSLMYLSEIDQENKNNAKQCVMSIERKKGLRKPKIIEEKLTDKFKSKYTFESKTALIEDEESDPFSTFIGCKQFDNTKSIKAVRNGYMSNENMVSENKRLCGSECACTISVENKQSIKNTEVKWSSVSHILMNAMKKCNFANESTTDLLESISSATPKRYIALTPHWDAINDDTEVSESDDSIANINCDADTKNSLRNSNVTATSNDTIVSNLESDRISKQKSEKNLSLSSTSGNDKTKNCLDGFFNEDQHQKMGSLRSTESAKVNNIDERMKQRNVTRIPTVSSFRSPSIAVTRERDKLNYKKIKLNSVHSDRENINSEDDIRTHKNSVFFQHSDEIYEEQCRSHRSLFSEWNNVNKTCHNNSSTEKKIGVMRPTIPKRSTSLSLNASVSDEKKLDSNAHIKNGFCADSGYKRIKNQLMNAATNELTRMESIDEVTLIKGHVVRKMDNTSKSLRKSHKSSDPAYCDASFATSAAPESVRYSRIPRSFQETKSKSLALFHSTEGIANAGKQRIVNNKNVDSKKSNPTKKNTLQKDSCIFSSQLKFRFMELKKNSR